MSARLVSLAELSDADLDAWHRLAAEALEPNPFFEPAFVLPAAEAIPARGLALLIAESDGEWVALTPVHRVRRWHRVPLPGLVTWSHSYSFLGTPLVRGDASNALAELCRAGLGAVGPGGFLGFDTVHRDGPVSAALGAALDQAGARSTELIHARRAMLHRRGDGEYLTMKPKHLRELRRKRARLGDMFGEPPQAVLDTSDEAIEAFLRLEASGWKGRAGTALARVSGGDAFLRSVCRGFRDQRRLRLIALNDEDGLPLAMMCNLLAGEGVFAFKIAFDESWAKYSPGILLIADQMGIFHETPGLNWIDSCADPDNEMINRLWADRRELTTIAVTRPVAGSLSRTVFRAASRVREARKGSR